MTQKGDRGMWLVIIYLNESGDLGFDFENNRPSKKFVITLLVCNPAWLQEVFARRCGVHSRTS